MKKAPPGKKTLSDRILKLFRHRQLLLAAAVIAPATAQAQFPADRDDWVNPAKDLPDLPPPPPLPKKVNRFGVGIRFGFNITADFKNVSPFPDQPNPGPATGNGIDRFYDDGYVRPDETFPNNNGLTFFWGYENASQVTPTDILFHSAGSAFDDAGRQHQDDVGVGMELTYSRELGANGYGSWGIEGGFAFTDLSLRHNGSEDGFVSLLTDAYSRGNPPIVPPAPPFSGTFNGVNLPSIGDLPTRSIDTVPATVTGTRDLVADVYSLRLGPYFAFPLSRRADLMFGVGLATAIVDSRFKYNEDTTTAAGTVNRRGNGTDTGYLFGPYVSGNLHYRLNNNLGVFGGVQFQSLGSTSQEVAGKRARIDLGTAIFGQAGVTISFK